MNSPVMLFDAGGLHAGGITKQDKNITPCRIFMTVRTSRCFHRRGRYDGSSNWAILKQPYIIALNKGVNLS